MRAVLYELATGTRPFRETVPAKLTDAILHSDPEPPLARRPGISQGLSKVILKCLEKEPDLRYQTAAELKLDLERLASPTVPTATMVSRWPSRAGGSREQRLFFSSWPDFAVPPGLRWDAYTRWIPEELKRRNGKPWLMNGFIAASYAFYGEAEKAFPYLERSIDERDPWFAQLMRPEFDSLRKDPRFLALIKRMNLPVEVYDRPYREVAAAARRPPPSGS